MKGNFLPITREEMKERGWDQVDFVYVSGDAYVDHPSFGHAIITRLLESRGYRVGIIAQPDWGALLRWRESALFFKSSLFERSEFGLLENGFSRFSAS